jgi:hypothetical protein
VRLAITCGDLADRIDHCSFELPEVRPVLCVVKKRIDKFLELFDFFLKVFVCFKFLRN